MSNNQISINNLSKLYDNGFEALQNLNSQLTKGLNTSVVTNTPTYKLLEKSGKGNIKNPAINPTNIEIYAVFSLIFLL